MLLQAKTAIIYGGGGSVGAAVGSAFAREGATVVLTGRTEPSLRRVADEIAAAGGKVETAVVDATNGAQVDAHAQEVVDRHGRLDISFNMIGYGDVQGAPLAAMAIERFLLPIDTAMRSQFHTGTAAARHMREGGVILAITANCGRQPFPDTGGFGVACAAIEGLCRQFAVELGPRGIRVVCLMSAGSPDSAGVSEVFDLHARNAGISREEWDRRAGEGTMLRHLPNLAEVADAAAIMASDRARAMSGAIANVTCGQIAD